ncbi:MAG: L-glutamate gamma-semialdehyde dehydrogenase [Rhodothermales bacterium]
MNNTSSHTPAPVNEPVRTYAPGSPERASLQAMLADLRTRTIEVPAFIGDRRVTTGRTARLAPPHDHRHTLGHVHLCDAPQVEQAIGAALAARSGWMNMHWTDRAAIFLKAADLLAGPWRDTINGATMLGQGKNVHQAEIDSACELIDFLRFNVHFMEQIYRDQPYSPAGTWNRLQYRPLEGFVFAVTPFNFTAIQGNLPTSAALMGNTVIWKPSTTAAYSAYYLMLLFQEAGLPPGVINMVPGDGADVGDPVFASEHLAGLHFTGSTPTFQHMWRTIGKQIASYRTYPRIVGETGGKDFIVAHGSADPVAVATAIVRGGFEYQGQKCSAASRVYIARSIWPAVEAVLAEQMSQVRMGPVEDFSNFVNAVIDARAFAKIAGYIDAARKAEHVRVLHGGGYDDSVGYFIEPTVLLTTDPKFTTMCEEIFGPVVTLYVYDDDAYAETLALVDATSPYALTGAIFARERGAVRQALDTLVDAAGNFYINDKPTGAVVGQQPFGGARGSGTNDKAGAMQNLLRWVSTRTVKETFVPPRHFGYPYLGSE